jgi:hypothetical protein
MKNLKYIKVFEDFSPQNKKTEQLYKLIDRLEVDEYMKISLKNSQDLLIIWNANYGVNQGITELMELFQPGSVDFWNDYINELEQDSHIKSFYDSVEDFIEVLDRLNDFFKHPEVGYIMTNILGYCNPVALRYMTEKSIDNILKNKDLIRKFQALWEAPTMKTFILSSDGSFTLDGGSKGTHEIPRHKWEVTGVKPFVPTSEEEHDRKIEEIIMDKYSKEVK